MCDQKRYDARGSCILIERSVIEDTLCSERASRPQPASSVSPLSLPLETANARDLNTQRQRESLTSNPPVSDGVVQSLSQPAQVNLTGIGTAETKYPGSAESPVTQTVNPTTSEHILESEPSEKLQSGTAASLSQDPFISEQVTYAEPSSKLGDSLPEGSSGNNMRTAISDEVRNSPDTSGDLIPGDKPLRKLTSLKWPYVPDEPSYPDPLKRDDPKPLNLAQYEAIGERLSLIFTQNFSSFLFSVRPCQSLRLSATQSPYHDIDKKPTATSPAVRHALSSHPRLRTLLRSIDQLRGSAREGELERVLGVSESQSGVFTVAGLSSASTSASTSTSSD